MAVMLDRPILHDVEYELEIDSIQPPPDDPFKYGWRELPQYDAAGEITGFERIPLTLRDVLHPQEEDFIVHTNKHEEIRMNLASILRRQTESDPKLLVLSDVRVDWQDVRFDPHGPDIAVFGNLSRYIEWATFRVKDEQAEPLLVIEIVSPSTRVNDVYYKPLHYAAVGVPQYVLIDAVVRRGEKSWSLTNYQLFGNHYLETKIPDGDHLAVDGFGFSLVIEDNDVVCYSDQGEKLGDYVEVFAQREAARAQAKAERERAVEEKRRADAEKQRADAAEAANLILLKEIERLRG